MERDAEIGQLNHELAILQARYALYRRTARIMRVIFMVLAPFLLIAGIAFTAKVFLVDVLYGLLLTGALVVFVVLVGWRIKSADLRWIDIVCPQIRSIYNPYFFYPEADRDRRPRSDAELLEWQIAARQRRLAELASGLPGAS